MPTVWVPERQFSSESFADKPITYEFMGKLGSIPNTFGVHTGVLTGRSNGSKLEVMLDHPWRSGMLVWVEKEKLEVVSI